MYNDTSQSIEHTWRCSTQGIGEEVASNLKSQFNDNQWGQIMAGSEHKALIFQDHSYRGTVYPNSVLDSTIDAMQTFHVRPDDVWVVTYPKAGMDWNVEHCLSL